MLLADGGTHCGKPCEGTIDPVIIVGQFSHSTA